MHSLWRKLCGLALGVALLPSLAGGGACFEHAVHAVVGADTAAAGENGAGDEGEGHDAHAAHAVASNAPQHAAAGEVFEPTTDDCCPPIGSPDHCAGAAGCSVSAIAIAADLAAQHTSASRVLALAGALAPPGPARIPDVPPPRA